MSMLRCPACEAWVDERGQPKSGPWRCSACGMRFSPPRKEGTAAEPGFRDDEGLGIHPALARKYKRHATPAGGVDVGAARSGSGPAPRAEASGPAPNADPAEPPLPVDDENELPPEMSADDDGAPTIQLSPSLVNEGAGETDEPVNLKERAEQTRPLRKQDEERAADQKDPDPADEEPQRPGLPEIPGYKFLSVVGKGAMGCVYRATWQTTDERVAVKILAKELAARPDFVARFEREAAALKAVDHPGVVSILDRGSHDEHHYLSMPFVEGASLRRALGKGALQPIRALGFARQIARALGAAHAKKVIHRDLKPENILLQRVPDPDGGPEIEKLILVDFGLAGMGEDDPHPNLTKSRMTMGTVNYMAPEQRTDAKRVGPQADVYAAGVILYELLTGDLPLGRFKMPTARPGLAHLPKKVDECVGRALDRDPEQRYATCAEMDADLAVIEAELEAQVSRDTVVGRVGKAEADEAAPTEVASGEPGALAGASDPAVSSEPLSDEEGPVSTEGSERPSTSPQRRSHDRSAPASQASSSGYGSSVMGSAGPQWVTAPPWVKRPLLVWGTLALLVGAAIGVWTAPADEGAADPSATGGLRAFAMTFAPAGPGWSTQKGALAWSRPSPDAAWGRVIAGEAPGAKEPTGRASVRLPDEAFSWAGLALVRGEQAVGLAVRGDRTCARFDPRAEEPVLQELPCAVPQTGPTSLTLACDTTGELACRGRGGSGADVELNVLEGTAPGGAGGAGPWQLELWCGGSGCTFEGAESK